jgi:FkbM family methyltransferase
MNVNINISLPTLHSSSGYGFLWDYLLECGRSSVSGQADPKAVSFMAFCLQNSAHSKAQLMQDLYVLYRLPKCGGFFVEFGASDGITISNTYMLESQMSWSGVVAEPLPLRHSALRANRKCTVDLRCVWTKTGEELDFVVPNEAPELATLNSFLDADHQGHVRSNNSTVCKVTTISLNDLLLANDAPKHLDYLSVDTEGSELAILSSLDFDRWRPRIITVEHNYANEQRNKTKALLNGYGYVREMEACSKWDDWYYHPELLSMKDK